MLREIVAALIFAGFLASMIGICVWVSTLPPVRRLQEWLTPDPEGGEDDEA